MKDNNGMLTAKNSIESKDLLSQVSFNNRAQKNSFKDSSYHEGNLYHPTPGGFSLPYQKPRYSNTKSNRREKTLAIPTCSEGKHSIDKSSRHETKESLYMARDKLTTADRLLTVSPNLHINLPNINFKKKS